MPPAVGVWVTIDWMPGTRVASWVPSLHHMMLKPRGRCCLPACPSSLSLRSLCQGGKLTLAVLRGCSCRPRCRRPLMPSIKSSFME